MTERLVQPPEIVEVEGPVIFLAGPIQGARDWQSEAFRIINQLDSGIVVASPRKNYAEGEFVYEGQVDWESHFLKRAAKEGVILFWLANRLPEDVLDEETRKRVYAQTSRLELGEWMTRHQYEAVRMVVGYEPDFGNVRYIKRRLEQQCPNIPVTESLEDTCQKAVELATG